MEEVRTRGGELITTNEPTVVAKPLLDPIAVENGERNGGLADSTGADESDWKEVLGEGNHLPDQLIASEEGSWWERG